MESPSEGDLNTLFQRLDTRSKGFLTCKELIDLFPNNEEQEEFMDIMRRTLEADQDKIGVSEFRKCIQEYYSMKNATSLLSPIPAELSIQGKQLGPIKELSETFNFQEEQYECEGELETNPYKPSMNQNTFDEIDESSSTSGVGGSLIGMTTMNPVTMHELDVMYQEHERLKNDIMELQSQVQKTHEGREQAIEECKQLQNKLSFMEVHFRDIEQNWKEKFDSQLIEMQSKIKFLERQKQEELKQLTENEVQSYILRRLESLEHRTPKENEEYTRLLNDREELKKQKTVIEKELQKTERSYKELKMSFDEYRQRTGKQMVDNLREKDRAMGLMEQIHLELEVTRGKLHLAMGQPVDLDQYSENSKRLYDMIHKPTDSENRLRSPSLGCWVETEKALKSGSKLVSEESYEGLIRRLTLENKTLTELLQHTQADLLAQRTANRHGLSSNTSNEDEEEMDRSYYDWINEPIPRISNKSLAEEFDGLGETQLKHALAQEKETTLNLRTYLDKILNVIVNTHHVGLLEIVTANTANVESSMKPFHEVRFCKHMSPNGSQTTSRRESMLSEAGSQKMSWVEKYFGRLINRNKRSSSVMSS